MTVWLDVPGVEAAGYVALSRVERDADWRFVGDPTVNHFVPASRLRLGLRRRPSLHAQPHAGAPEISRRRESVEQPQRLPCKA